MNIRSELEYLRVLSLCSAPSCHHHKWSWMSIVSIFGSQDLPSTHVRRKVVMFVDFVNSFIDELQQFRHRCCNWSEFDEALLSESKRSCDQKIKVAFRLLKFKMKLKPWDEVKIHGKGNQMLRWRLRSWSWGSERRVCERKFARLRLKLNLYEIWSKAEMKTSEARLWWVSLGRHPRPWWGWGCERGGSGWDAAWLWWRVFAILDLFVNSCFWWRSTAASAFHLASRRDFAFVISKASAMVRSTSSGEKNLEPWGHL